MRKVIVYVGVTLFGIVVSIPLSVFIGMCVGFAAFVDFWRGLMEGAAELAKPPSNEEEPNNTPTESVWDRHQRNMDAKYERPTVTK